MDSVEIAWAAGLIEGEGTVCVKGSGGLYVGASMTDEDVIRKIHSISGIGTVTMPKKLENRKQTKQQIEQLGNKLSKLFAKDKVTGSISIAIRYGKGWRSGYFNSDLS